MMKWEYLKQAVAANELDERLKQLGELGWELAGTAQGGVMKSPLATQAAPGFLLIFKRPVEEEAEVPPGSPRALAYAAFERRAAEVLEAGNGSSGKS